MQQMSLKLSVPKLQAANSLTPTECSPIISPIPKMQRLWNLYAMLLKNIMQTWALSLTPMLTVAVLSMQTARKSTEIALLHLLPLLHWRVLQAE